MRISVQISCPDCGSRKSLRILYGLPSAKSFEAAGREKIALGGCVIYPGQPTRECSECGTRFSRFPALRRGASGS